jgi:hypothetical protein
MKWAKRAKMSRPGLLVYHLPPLCLKVACSYAADGGNQEVLEWLHNSGCPWDAATACAAAGGGHLEMVQWLHSHGCPWDIWTPACAAKHGHLAVLQWARARGCPWHWMICTYAAMAGQLEVLQWVRENDATGEVWSERFVRIYAAGPRKKEVLAWLDDLSGL